MENNNVFEIGKTYPGKGEVKGVGFKLLKRKEDICLFERSDGYFEVIEIRKQEAGQRKIKDKVINFEEKEIYPSGDSWSGKCVSTLERAEKIFE